MAKQMSLIHRNANPFLLVEVQPITALWILTSSASICKFFGFSSPLKHGCKILQVSSLNSKLNNTLTH